MKERKFSAPLSTLSSTTLWSPNLVIGDHKYVKHLFQDLFIIDINFWPNDIKIEMNRSIILSPLSFPH